MKCIPNLMSKLYAGTEATNSFLIFFCLFACLYWTKPGFLIGAAIWAEQGQNPGRNQSSGIKTVEQIETVDT